jgi:lipoyl(octanoyl) transferase
VITVQQHSRPGNSNSEWRIEEDFEASGAHLMRRDEDLALERIAQPDLPSVLRLYSWSPYAVSIGYKQKLESVDLEACNNAGIDVVRRPTGGRAVLHAEELTYAVIMRASPEQGIYAAHNQIVEALLASLEGLGPEFQNMQITGRSSSENFRSNYQSGTLTNAACFASTARHEVTYLGKKVIGSAQRRFGDVLLQHGSILLSNEHLRLPDLLVLTQDERVRMLRLLQAETATLSDVFGRSITPLEAANSVKARFIHHICNRLHEPSETV